LLCVIAFSLVALNVQTYQLSSTLDRVRGDVSMIEMRVADIARDRR